MTQAATPTATRIVALSNRGPLSWRRDDDGKLTARRGAGGLVSALGPALASTGGIWIATALSDDDRAAAQAGLSADDDAGYDVQLLDIPDDVLTGALEVVSNQFLWYAHHDLWNRPRTPAFGTDAHQAWERFVRFNRFFADAAASVCEPETTVLVQDYHLSLVPALLAERGVGARVAHFTHTPFATESALAVLPREWAMQVVAGIGAADVAGFHTRRWADRFVRAAGTMPGGGAGARVGVFPLGPDPEVLAGEAAQPSVAEERSALEAQIGRRRPIVRVDRAELSKNVIRGLQAFDELLVRRPALVDDIVHVVLLNPSRQALQEYREYLDDCISTADAICDRHGRDVVILYAEDRFPRSLAAFALADVIVANPISDGMNLVAKEGPLVNERDAPLVLSTEAGAYEQLGEMSIGVNPYDVSEQTDALETALGLDDETRRRSAASLQAVCAGDPPQRWLDLQMEALAR